MSLSREIEEKTERLLRLVSKAGLGGLLINSQPNFSWLTAGGTNGIDLSREAGAGTLFLRHDGMRFVLANRIEMDRLLTEELDGQSYQPVEFAWEEEKGNPSLIADIARSLVTEELPLGSDLPSGGDVRLVNGAIARARYELTAAEVDRFKALGRDAGKAIGDMARKLEPGVTEKEVARSAIDALAAVGAYSVVTLVAADDRLKGFRHPVPTDLQWKKVLMIVVCARRGGLIASLTRIVCDGAMPEDLGSRTRGSAFVNARLFDGTKPGVTGRELYELAALAYSEAGFSGEEHLHHQGGATGYHTRDWVAHPLTTEKVQNGQAFAWNPSITGSKVEETCIAFKDGIEIITATPGWPRDQMAGVPGIVDLIVEPQVGVPQVQVNMDRQAAEAVGLRAADLAETVDTAFNGHVASQVLEEQKTYDVLVRFDDTARESVEAIGRTLIDTPTGARVPIGQVAEVRVDQGPNTINRENVQRRIIIQANVADRDLGSVINDVRAAIGNNVQLPQGYFVQYGGQFEAQEKASRLITLLSIVAIGGIFLLLYIALKSARSAALVMANLPLALIGGVVMVFLSGGTLSIASLVGFITLFGIATRNGIMLISHYMHLMEEEGVSFRDAIVQGSMERLSPILMTALVTGVGLIPLALGSGEPGKEIQQPMAVVILGGIVTSTFLNMIVIPALYLKYGRAEAIAAAREYPEGQEFAPVRD